MTARLANRLRREEGFAVPTVVLLIAAAMAVAGAIVVSSISAQHGTIRDKSSKLALAAAEAGVSEALTHYNSVSTSNGQPCLLVSSGTIVRSGPSTGWCGPVGPGSSNGGTYTYRVRPTVNLSTFLVSGLEIVSIGTVAGVSRRVKVFANSAAGNKIFCPQGVGCKPVQTQDGINLNSNAELHAASATNGGITLGSNAKLCSEAQVGIGESLTLNGGSGYFADANCTQPTSAYTQQELVLPPVNQGDAATNNDNERLTNAVTGLGTPRDLISGNPLRVSWNPATRHLAISSNTALTLTGSKYSLCSLTMSSNTILTVASTQNASIFFDSPENCGMSSPATQVSMFSNARISAASGTPVAIALYFVGSPEMETRANFSSNTQVGGACESNFVIYAPRTDVTINSNATYCGALAAKTLQMDSNAKIYTDLASQDFTLTLTGAHFVVSKFLECSASEPAGSPGPDGGC